MASTPTNSFLEKRVPLDEKERRCVIESVKRELAKMSNEEKKAALKLVVNCLDLTSLSSTDTDAEIAALAQKALHLGNGVGECACVCVYSGYASLFTHMQPRPKLALVCPCFPHGKLSFQMCIDWLQRLDKSDFDEVDIVIDRGLVLCGKYEQLFTEIKRKKEVLGRDKVLKTILSVGELKDDVEIYNACRSVISAGSDFVKTSTGKEVVNASLETAYTMLLAIKDAFKDSGVRTGFKAAGGIRTCDDAISYFLLVKEVLGEDWLNPKLFRIGASSLLDKIIDHFK